MKLLKFVPISVFLVSFTLACAAKETSTTPAIPEILVPKAQVGGEERWEIEWEKILKEARREGKVVIYSATQGPALRQAIGLFRQTYGLDLEVTSGRGGELLTKIVTERANGIFLVDVFNTGMNTNSMAKSRKILDPLEPALILPEVRDPKVWFGGELPWGDEDRVIFRALAYPSSAFGINTQQVRPEEINSYYDLLSPKWKDKISINDPTVAGAGFNAFSSLVLQRILDLDFFRKLIEQQPSIMRDQRLQIDWLSRGKHALALWPQPDPLAEYKKVGAPVDFLPIPKEGVQLASGGGPVSLVNRAPHPNAAKVFINWLLSREGQLFLQKAQEIQSTRVDISTEGIDPLKIREPAKKYFQGANSIEKWLLEEQDKYLEMSKNVFAPLLK